MGQSMGVSTAWPGKQCSGCHGKHYDQQNHCKQPQLHHTPLQWLQARDASSLDARTSCSWRFPIVFSFLQTSPGATTMVRSSIGGQAESRCKSAPAHKVSPEQWLPALALCSGDLQLQIVLPAVLCCACKRSPLCCCWQSTVGQIC